MLTVSPAVKEALPPNNEHTSAIPIKVFLTTRSREATPKTRDDTDVPSLSKLGVFTILSSPI
jgi:hypothetical protein